METPTGFDLNTSIEAWRAHLRQSPQIRPEDVGELESHLRDSVDVLRTKDLSSEEAFLIASRRLGNALVLEDEFAKVNLRELWLNRVFWMLVGILLWQVLGITSCIISNAAVTAGLLGFGYQPSTSAAVLPGILFGAVQIAALVLSVLGCRWLIHRAGGSLGKTAARLVQDPVRVVLAVVAFSLGLIACQGASGLLMIYHLKHMAPAAIGALNYSRTIGFGVTWPLETFALVTATVLLARHRARRAIKA